MDTPDLSHLATAARALAEDYQAYQAALALLREDGRTVAERTRAVGVRDLFERQQREGVHDLGQIARYAAEQAERAQVNEQGGFVGKVGG